MERIIYFSYRYNPFVHKYEVFQKRLAGPPILLNVVESEYEAEVETVNHWRSYERHCNSLDFEVSEAILPNINSEEE